MSKETHDPELHKILTSIEKSLSTIKKNLSNFDARITKLEQLVENRNVSAEGNPLIYSRVLMYTLDTIKEYEKKNHQGVVAKDLAKLRSIELPTIYDHLSKLEEAQLILWQRGTELGLKPHNAKFYSVMQREERLSDLPVLMGLPEHIIPIAQTILKSSSKGVNKIAIVDFAKSLSKKGEKSWKNAPPEEIENRVNASIQYLLRRVLITRKRTPDDEYLFSWE